MNINLKELINLGQVVLLKEGLCSNRTLRFGKAICIPVDPHRGGINVTIPLVIDLTESMQYISKDETWLCIENTPEDFKEFEFPDGFKVGLLTQAIKQNNTDIFPAIKLAKSEGILQELHTKLLNQLIKVAFEFQQEPDESWVDIHIERYVSFFPTDLIPLGVYVVEQRSINREEFFYYVHPQVFSLETIYNTSVIFSDIIEVAYYYKDKDVNNVNVELSLHNGIRHLSQEEILQVSQSRNG